MTPTERATNLIQRIERLFERATPAPWEADLESDHGDYVIWGPEPYQFLANIGSDRIEPILSPKEGSTAVVAFDLAAANASLIVILRNVGLEGVVGPIRALIEVYSCCSGHHNDHDDCTYCDKYLTAISAACDLWEPELDREEGRK